MSSIYDGQQQQLIVCCNRFSRYVVRIVFFSFIHGAAILMAFSYQYSSLLHFDPFLLAHTSDSKKPPNIPRLNSFKKDSKSLSQRRTLNTYNDVIYDGTSSNRSSSVDTSSDSGLHCSSTMADASYDVVPGSGKSTPLKHDNFYDPLPSSPAKMSKIFPSNLAANHSNVEVLSTIIGFFIQMRINSTAILISSFNYCVVVLIINL